ADPAPVHVLIVGTAATNAVVGRIGDDVAVFHCLEWFKTPGGARILTGHETTHAWHLLQMPAAPPDGVPAWTAFSEGLAIQVSRKAVPDQKEDDYFWYGLPRFGGWLEYCRANRDDLHDRLAKSLDDPAGAEAMFDGTPSEGPPRVGYFVADELVGGLGRTPSELVRLSVDDATAAIRSALTTAKPKATAKKPAGGAAKPSKRGKKSA
ncbi:MAG TPA: hypothetical protein VFO60_08925, partial [Candidatus Dormibacteraeota bacterium]|nr:hypothetical protein [Candidatus Dormibacteraeota bacterium]